MDPLVNQAKLMAEIQGRTEPTPRDIGSAFVEMGVDTGELLRYVLRSSKKNFPRIQARK